MMRRSLILLAFSFFLVAGSTAWTHGMGAQGTDSAPAGSTASTPDFSDYNVFKLPGLIEMAVRSPDREERLRALSTVAENQAASVAALAIDASLLAPVSNSNTVWSTQTALFNVLLKAPDGASDPAERSQAYAGPAAKFLRPLLADGRAAGNLGDLYENRDGGHSLLKTEGFPGLARTAYSPEAIAQNVHSGLARVIFSLPTVGNASQAQTEGPAWRSLPRLAYIDPNGVNRMALLYFFNQMHLYPEHKDHDPEPGDVYPANTPYIVITQGSSFSDQPFLKALFAALAAFQPETKQHLISNRQLMPTLQMLLRSTQKGADGPEAYFTGKCHPVVFNADRLNPPEMVRRAQAMKPADLVPTPTLRVIEESAAIPSADYFDTASETLFDSPCAIARVFRTLAYTRTLTVSASPVTPAPEGSTWRWAVLQGDPAKVRILPETSDRTRVRIEVDWHDEIRSGADDTLVSSRVDVGCFLTTPAGGVSAPAFVSVAFLRDELRRYSDDEARRLLSVDYTVKPPYVDPLLTAKRDWRDEYQYSTSGRRTGWTRHRGERTETFTRDGLLIESTDADGQPLLVRAITYRRQPPSAAGAMPVLLQEAAEAR